MATDPYGVPDELFRELGRVTWAASGVEQILRLLLADLVGDKGVAERLTADTTFRALVDSARSLTHYRLEGEPRDRALAWLAKAGDAYARRNRLIHSQWFTDPLHYGPEVARQTVRASARGKDYREEQEPISTAEVQSIADDLYAAQRSGSDLLAALRFVGRKSS